MSFVHNHNDSGGAANHPGSHHQFCCYEVRIEVPSGVELLDVEGAMRIVRRLEIRPLSRCCQAPLEEDCCHHEEKRNYQSGERHLHLHVTLITANVVVTPKAMVGLIEGLKNIVFMRMDRELLSNSCLRRVDGGVQQSQGTEASDSNFVSSSTHHHYHVHTAATVVWDQIDVSCCELNTESLEALLLGAVQGVPEVLEEALLAMDDEVDVDEEGRKKEEEENTTRKKGKTPLPLSLNPLPNTVIVGARVLHLDFSGNNHTLTSEDLSMAAAIVEHGCAYAGRVPIVGSITLKGYGAAAGLLESSLLSLFKCCTDLIDLGGGPLLEKEGEEEDSEEEEQETRKIRRKQEGPTFVLWEDACINKAIDDERRREQQKQTHHSTQQAHTSPTTPMISMVKKAIRGLLLEHCTNRCRRVVVDGYELTFAGGDDLDHEEVIEEEVEDQKQQEEELYGEVDGGSHEKARRHSSSPTLSCPRLPTHSDSSSSSSSPDPTRWRPRGAGEGGRYVYDDDSSTTPMHPPPPNPCDETAVGGPLLANDDAQDSFIRSAQPTYASIDEDETEGERENKNKNREEHEPADDRGGETDENGNDCDDLLFISAELSPLRPEDCCESDEEKEREEGVREVNMEPTGDERTSNVDKDDGAFKANTSSSDLEVTHTTHDGDGDEDIIGASKQAYHQVTGDDNIQNDSYVPTSSCTTSTSSPLPSDAISSALTPSAELLASRPEAPQNNSLRTSLSFTTSSPPLYTHQKSVAPDSSSANKILIRDSNKNDSCLALCRPPPRRASAQQKENTLSSSSSSVLMNVMSSTAMVGEQGRGGSPSSTACVAPLQILRETEAPASRGGSTTSNTCSIQGKERNDYPSSVRSLSRAGASANSTATLSFVTASSAQSYNSNNRIGGIPARSCVVAVASSSTTMCPSASNKTQAYAEKEEAAMERETLSSLAPDTASVWSRPPLSNKNGSINIPSYTATAPAMVNTIYILNDKRELISNSTSLSPRNDRRIKSKRSQHNGSSSRSPSPAPKLPFGHDRHHADEISSLLEEKFEEGEVAVDQMEENEGFREKEEEEVTEEGGTARRCRRRRSSSFSFSESPVLKAIASKCSSVSNEADCLAALDEEEVLLECGGGVGPKKDCIVLDEERSVGCAPAPILLSSTTRSRASSFASSCGSSPAAYPAVVTSTRRRSPSIATINIPVGGPATAPHLSLGAQKDIMLLGLGLLSSKTSSEPSSTMRTDRSAEEKRELEKDDEEEETTTLNQKEGEDVKRGRDGAVAMSSISPAVQQQEGDKEHYRHHHYQNRIENNDSENGANCPTTRIDTISALDALYGIGAANNCDGTATSKEEKEELPVVRVSSSMTPLSKTTSRTNSRERLQRADVVVGTREEAMAMVARALVSRREEEKEEEEKEPILITSSNPKLKVTSASVTENSEKEGEGPIDSVSIDAEGLTNTTAADHCDVDSTPTITSSSTTTTSTAKNTTKRRSSSPSRTVAISVRRPLRVGDVAIGIVPSSTSAPPSSIAPPSSFVDPLCFHPATPSAPLPPLSPDSPLPQTIPTLLIKVGHIPSEKLLSAQYPIMSARASALFARTNTKTKASASSSTSSSFTPFNNDNYDNEERGGRGGGASPLHSGAAVLSTTTTFHASPSSGVARNGTTTCGITGTTHTTTIAPSANALSHFERLTTATATAERLAKESEEQHKLETERKEKERQKRRERVKVEAANRMQHMLSYLRQATPTPAGGSRSRNSSPVSTPLRAAPRAEGGLGGIMHMRENQRSLSPRASLTPSSSSVPLSTAVTATSSLVKSSDTLAVLSAVLNPPPKSRSTSPSIRYPQQQQHHVVHSGGGSARPPTPKTNGSTAAPYERVPSSHIITVSANQDDHTVGTATSTTATSGSTSTSSPTIISGGARPLYALYKATAEQAGVGVLRTAPTHTINGITASRTNSERAAMKENEECAKDGDEEEKAAAEGRLSRRRSFKRVSVADVPISVVEITSILVDDGHLTKEVLDFGRIDDQKEEAARSKLQTKVPQTTAICPSTSIVPLELVNDSRKRSAQQIAPVAFSRQSSPTPAATYSNFPRSKDSMPGGGVGARRSRSPMIESLLANRHKLMAAACAAAQPTSRRSASPLAGTTTSNTQHQQLPVAGHGRLRSQSPQQEAPPPTRLLAAPSSGGATMAPSQSQKFSRAPSATTGGDRLLLGKAAIGGVRGNVFTFPQQHSSTTLKNASPVSTATSTAPQAPPTAPPPQHIVYGPPLRRQPSSTFTAAATTIPTAHSHPPTREAAVNINPQPSRACRSPLGLITNHNNLGGLLGEDKCRPASPAGALGGASSTTPRACVSAEVVRPPSRGRSRSSTSSVGPSTSAMRSSSGSAAAAAGRVPSPVHVFQPNTTVYPPNHFKRLV